MDKGIAQEILNQLEPRESSWDTPSVPGHLLLRDTLDEVTDLYMSKLPLLKINRPVPASPAVYTAMHGVGWRYVQTAFQTAGYPEPLPVSLILWF